MHSGCDRRTNWTLQGFDTDPRIGLTGGEVPRQDTGAFLISISLSEGLINLAALRHRGALNRKDYNLGRDFAS